MMKRILSCLLAFLLVVSAMPVYSFAEEEGSSVCNCGAAEGVTHVATCPAYVCPDCGTAGWHETCPETEVEEEESITCEICGNDSCTCETEQETPDLSGDVGKYAKFNEEFGSFNIRETATSEKDYVFYITDFEDNTIVHITNAHWEPETTGIWYQVEFYSGGVVEEAAEYWPATAWVLYNYMTGGYDENALLFLDTCNICEKPDCETEHVYCETCQKYDCGIDHEDTTPSISATVTDADGNTQTVTVSGDALPEGARLEVSSVQETVVLNAVGMTDGFLWDIKVYDADGNEWQPTAPVNVTMTTSDPEAKYAEIYHFLDNADAVRRAINGEGLGYTYYLDFSYLNDSYFEYFDEEIDAYREGLGTEDVGVMLSYQFNLEVEDGAFTFVSDSFSIFSSRSYSSKHSSYGLDSDNRIELQDKDGTTYYVTAGQDVFVDNQWLSSNINNWTVSGNADNAVKANTNGRVKVHVYDNASEGDKISINYTTALGYSDTIYLVVVKEYSITFNGNGGTVSGTNPIYFVTDEDVNNFNAVSVSRGEGYSFLGWFDAKTGGTSYTSWTRNESTTLYAQWTPITYTVKFNANGGTGTMANQTMTYDQSAALNANEFAYPTPGYVCAGWSTTAGGSAVYTNGQTVSNLTSTNGAVVNLYAVWVNTMEISDVRIGLNESYWYTDFMYTVTTDGVASSSYHAFPAEPAQQSIRHMRPVDDANGNWSMSTDSILYGNASDYIDPSIVYSEMLIHSYIATQDTWGVADSTGTKVKAFLKFTDSDYTAIIKVWLQSMADRTEDTPNEDGTYNITNKGNTYKTDVNWNEEVDNWEDYEIVPYVIKLENSNVWIIDMVAVPLRYLTLSYNLNINTASGYSLTGGSSIPNTQYDRDSTQKVYSAPTEYNANTKVSKTVNGVEYVAKFLYWEDEQGNKYGAGYNTTIVMDSHKTLKAIWEYPDQTMGSLRVEKEVTVPAGTGLSPDTTKEFTVKVILGTSGTYPYTKYSSTGIVTETGNFSGTEKSFALKSDEYVIITGINQGVTYAVSETPPTGYTNKSGTIAGTIQAGNTMSATIVNEPSSYTLTFDFNGGSNTNRSVTVVYGSTNYYDVSWLDPEKAGCEFLGWYTSAGTQVYGTDGLCLDCAYWSSNKWTGTSDLTVYARWKASEYTVTWKNWDGTVLDTDTVAYDDMPSYSGTVPTRTDSTGAVTYTWTGWTPAVSKVTGNVEYTATFSEESSIYKVTLDNQGADSGKEGTAEYWYRFNTTVKHEYEDVNDGGLIYYYTDASCQIPFINGTGPDRYYSITIPQKTGYVFGGYFTEINGTGTQYINANGICINDIWKTEAKNTTLYAYWIPVYTITWLDDDGSVIDTTTVAYGEIPTHADPGKVATAEYTYTFAGWSPEVVAVTGEATYQATYTAEKNKYTVTWKNEDGTVLETDIVEYGATPSYGGEKPEKVATVQYTYVFDGWDKEAAAVTGDVTYTATFSATVNKYTVTFVDEDGTVLLVETAYDYGTKAADIVKPADPSKEATDEFTYTFAGWTPEIAEVTANVIYKATYTQVKNQYTLSGEIDHGTVTDSVTVDYGTEAKITFTPAVGYKFHSWKVNGGTATLITTAAATWSYEDPQLTENKHVVVTMAPIEYTITYDLRYGELGEGITNPETYNIETDDFTLNNPARDGYKFLGWAQTENATTGTETYTIEKGTTGDKIFYAVWERSLVDLIITAECDDQEQSFIFTVSGTRSDGVAFTPIDVVLCSENDFTVTIKDLPVGEYTVTEKNDWSWREVEVDPREADLRTTSQTVSFDFGIVDDLHWLSGYSYKRKKGGSK